MSQTEVQLIKDAVIVNADVSGSAAIDVSKISGAMPLAGGTFTDDVTFTGASANIVFDKSDNSLEFADDAMATFGGSADLRIRHNGNNSLIEDMGTGNLQIRGDDVHITGTNDEILAKFIENTGVELYHDGSSKKLETTSSGITVTQTVIASGNSATIKVSESGGGIGEIRSGGSTVYFGTESNHDVSFISNDAVGFKLTNGGHLVPNADSTHNLGHNVTRWANVYADNFHGDGSNLTGVTSTTISNNANNRVITGSDTANTLVAEAELKYYPTSSSDHMFVLGDTDTSAAAWSGTRQGFKAAGSQPLLYLVDDGNTSGDDAYVGHAGTRLYIAKKGGSITFQTSASGVGTANRWEINSDGHILPMSDNAYDIGSASYRARNVYTGDLNLSNEGASNDVDGTWGSYTIQEGSEDLFLINKRNGKKFKFNLTEVS